MSSVLMTDLDIQDVYGQKDFVSVALNPLWYYRRV